MPLAVREGPLEPSCDAGRPPPGPAALSERDLAHLWQGQRFPPAALAGRDGRPLTVVYRGRPAAGPGPDFRDAVIAAPRGFLRGDVELHVRASDFVRHGHHRDAGYDRLALHVVFVDDVGADTALSSGRRVPVAALAPWFQRRAEQIRAWLERPPLFQEPCYSALQRLGEEAVADALDRLGDRRLQEKAGAMRQRLALEPADEVLWQELLEALGYGGERARFRALARRLPWRRLRPCLLGRPPRERLTAARRLLLSAWHLGPPAREGRPRRPGNDPARRLEGAARLAVRFCPEGPGARVEGALHGAQAEGPSLLVAAFAAAQDRGGAFIGKSRALEIALNVALVYGLASGKEGLAGAVAALYPRLPLPARYGPVRHLHQALGRAVAVNARRQQGMLHLLRGYCSQGGCGRCPLS